MSTMDVSVKMKKEKSDVPENKKERKKRSQKVIGVIDTTVAIQKVSTVNSITHLR